MSSHESAADAPQHVPSAVRPPSISRLLAACSAAAAVSTPPDDEGRRHGVTARPGTAAPTAAEDPSAAEATAAGTTAADVLAATAPGRDHGTPSPDARPRSDVA